MGKKTDHTSHTSLVACLRQAAILLIVLMPLAVDLYAAERSVVFQGNNGGELCRFTVELAKSPQETERGLMFRKSLGARSGMLFIFNEDAPRFFWMKNTLIPLDLIFIDSRLKVVHVHASARPLDESPIPSDTPAKYVLEVNAGRAADCRIISGTSVRFLNVNR
jgi:uncharacterized protein